MATLASMLRPAGRLWAWVISPIWNGLLSALLFLLIVRVLAPAVLGVGSSSNRVGQLAVILCCYAMFGVLAGVWTRYWLALVPPAAAGFLFALGVFKFAIYFGDMRGEPTVSMWHYILNPSLGELLYAAAAGVATLAGWFLWRRVRAGRS